jgi:RNA polymerase sigma factor (TIGR02999 family)
MSEVTRLLGAANRGDRRAAAELLPVVYGEPRKLAAARLAREQPGQTLDATARVHQAFLRLVGGQRFEGQGHFSAAAAGAVRRILVEQARRRQALKRGGEGGLGPEGGRVDLPRLRRRPLLRALGVAQPLVPIPRSMTPRP